MRMPNTPTSLGCPAILAFLKWKSSLSCNLNIDCGDGHHMFLFFFFSLICYFLFLVNEEHGVINEWLICSLNRFLNAVKQYLCLSLLKNSGLSVMAIFQLLCSIFWNLLSKFRSGLKSEIGIFFPMLILRVLENVLQPSFLQKMTVLSLLEKISEDPQIVIDIFVNYDCDVEAPNIFER